MSPLLTPISRSAPDVSQDQLLLVRVDGMHSHRCETTVRRALLLHAGVHEVEVDFPSAQASVLFDPAQTDEPALLDSVRRSGYRVASSTLLKGVCPEGA